MMSKHPVYIWIQSFVIVLSLSHTTAYAQTKKNEKEKRFEGLLNKLIAPGPLMEGHKNLEHKDCLSCHEPLGGVPNSKCLDCHRDIQRVVKANKGFHGFHRKKPCIECHKDHKGRNYNAVYVNQKTFNHNQTGFKLEGGHSKNKVKCEECHTKRRTKKPIRRNETRYFGTSNSCLSCHLSDSTHYFKGKYAKKECSECHGIVNWKYGTKFNHARETGYKLVGNHAKLDCAKCHAPKGPRSAKYKWPRLNQNACLSCHNDHHKNNVSKKFQNGRCDTCHSQISWPIANFNHNITGWPLNGAHAKTQCIDCHKQPSGRLQTSDKSFKFTGLKTSCASCHADYHGFSGKKSRKIGDLSQCQICHGESSFKQPLNFNHNLSTRFEITGMHKKNACFDCHVPTRTMSRKKPARPNERRLYYWKNLKSKSCENCHKSPHSNSFRKKFKNISCEGCHQTSGWKKIKLFEGSELDKKRSFHQKTRFPLTGKHQKASCSSCHNVKGKQVYRFPNADKNFCINCHTNVHKKQFSSTFSAKACSDCHTTNNFIKRKPFNHNSTRFRLTGRHKDIEQECSKCHKPTRNILPTKPPKRASQYRFEGRKEGFCFNCHANQHKDMFKSRFANRPCYSCHNTYGFERLNPFNHNQTSYPLLGKHKDVACEKCHTPTRKRYTTKPYNRKGLYQFPDLDRKGCISCHANPHKPSRGNNCAKCHSVRGWKQAANYHEHFTLNGVHLNLDCDSCHTSDRSLKGSSEDCMSCHYHEDIHHGQLNDCKTCHMQSFWEATTFDHNTTRFPLLGAHRLADCRACHNQGVYQGLPTDCSGCHASQALQVTAPSHAPARYGNCENCHNNFSFKGATSAQ